MPVRHGRMMVSPFTFYRGAAKIMAADLAGTPTAGLNVQLCGDAHLSNFGAFASPERRAAVRPQRLRRDPARAVRVRREADGGELHHRRPEQRLHQRPTGGRRPLASVRAYREAMAEFAEMGTMDLWYAHLSEDDLRDELAAVAPNGQARRRRGQAGKDSKAGKDGRQGRGRRRRPPSRRQDLRKAHTRDSLQALSKLGELVDGRYRIVSQPPIVVPLRDLGEHLRLDAATRSKRRVHDQFREYRATLQDDRRHLLERFEVVDVARKVVGVGSVGTRAFIVLLQGRDEQDPLFLQVKEATRRCWRTTCRRAATATRRAGGAGPADDAGGQRHLPGLDQGRAGRPLLLLAAAARHEGLGASSRRCPPACSTFYARLCGWTLARAHARSGDPVAIAAYLGNERRVRPVDHRLLRALRRPERAGLPGLRRRRSAPDGCPPSRVI